MWSVSFNADQMYFDVWKILISGNFREVRRAVVSLHVLRNGRAVYSAVPLSLNQYHQNTQRGHPIARRFGRGAGCLFGVQLLIDILPQFLQWCMQYLVILDPVITAPHCTDYHVFATHVLTGAHDKYLVEQGDLNMHFEIICWRVNLEPRKNELWPRASNDFNVTNIVCCN